MIVTLPWPNRILSPNARAHWSGIARAKRKARVDAYYLAKAERPAIASTAPLVSIDFLPPDNRRRDLDNLIASMKAALDGIAEAMGVDDHTFRLAAKMGAPKPPHGAVIVTVTP